MEQFLIDWEGPVLLWIQEHMRNDFLTPVLTFLTHLGDHGYFWIALTILFLLLKKTRKVSSCEIPVAQAAPANPQWKPKTNNASSTMFVIAPSSTPKVDNCGNPSALINTSNE